MTKRISNWIFALALTIPMILFFVGYLFNHDPALLPTGFIQYDNVSYIAYAHQYLDGNPFQPGYSNPFNDSGLYPPIYFQPQTLLFALLLKLGLDGGSILIPFTLVCALGCFRLLIAIYDHLFPASKYRTTSIVLLAWGGGLLVMSGMLAKLFDPAVDSIFHLDPGAGWWGLNLGRALFFSCEAYYHLLFLAVIFCLLKKRWLAALGISALLSISHPFTGVELLAITTAWAGLDRMLFRNKEIPWWYIAGSLLLLLLHLYYYLFYLPLAEDHRSVNDQYELNWKLRFFSIIPAYAITGFLALLAWVKVYPGKKIFQASHHRLFFTWLIIAFALANHELFMKPMQPLHFTRGYIWTALMLIGIPGLHYFMERFKRPGAGKILTALFIFLFLSDNMFWIYHQAGIKATQASTSYITKEEDELLSQLGREVNDKTLVVSTDEKIAYLGTVYSSAYPWTSHPFTTPFVDRKRNSLERFMATGVPDSSWFGRDLVFIFRKGNPGDMQRAASLPYMERLVETENYLLVRGVLQP